MQKLLFRAASDHLLLLVSCHRSAGSRPRPCIVREVATLNILSLYGEKRSICQGIYAGSGSPVLPHESILNQKHFIVVLFLTNFQSFVIRVLDPNNELVLVRLVVLKVEQ